jgi:uncharacterized protein
MKTKVKITISALTLLPLLFCAVIWLAGTVLSHSVNRKVGDLPGPLKGRDVTFPSESGATIRGWLIEGQTGKGAVILLHGVRDSRLSMLDRARFLAAAGYSVLLFDFQAHGESNGAHITFGHLESRDVQAAVKFMRDTLPDEKIGVLGVSLGGAATLLSEPTLEVNAAIVEMVYPTIRQAIDNRLKLHLGGWAGVLTPLFMAQLKPRLGIGPEALQPIHKISGVKVPKLIIAASEDKHTPLAESQDLFNAAPEPKEFWVIHHARHEDLHRFAQQEYEHRVLSFFERMLR